MVRRTIVWCAVLVLWTGAAGADWTYLVDLDRGELPNEFHSNIQDRRLTTEHARPGHVALSFRPVGKGWVTRYNMWHNWTWYDRVSFRMFNANTKPVTFGYEVRTRHKRRANIQVTVKPGENYVVLRFADFKNIAEKPFVLWDVAQWVIFFSEELPKPLYLSEYRLIRENIELAWPNEKNVAARWKAEDATLSSEKEAGDPVPVFWATASFPAGKTGRVWTELRPGDRRFNTFAFPAIWLGYERITFVCDNPQAAPVKFELLLEDFTAQACRDTKFRDGQAAAVPLLAAPGRHPQTVSLKDLKTADGRRRLDLSQMYRIGFGVKDPQAETKLRFTDIRIRTTNEDAGILVPSEGKRRCARCRMRLDDANCNACPFCGRFYNANAVVTEPAPKSVKLVPVKDASVMASSGGGQPTVDQESRRGSGLNVCHYDVSFWEGRTFFRFDPAKIAPGARIKKAELRLSSRNVGSGGKSWLCPVRIFAPPDGRDDFDEAKLSWITQPPIGEFVAQGGLYYYWTDRVALDVTDWLRARLAKTRAPFTLILRAFEAEPVKADAHLLGHFFPMYSRESREEEKRPHLYVQFE